MIYELGITVKGIAKKYNYIVFRSDKLNNTPILRVVCNSCVAVFILSEDIKILYLTYRVYLRNNNEKLCRKFSNLKSVIGRSNLSPSREARHEVNY